LYFDQCHWPLLGSVDEPPLECALRDCLWTAMASPPGPTESDSEMRASGARRLRTRTDRAILGLFGGNLLEMGQYLYRMDRFMEMLADEPARVHAFLDRLLEFHLANLDQFLADVGPYIDVIVFGDDLGGQNGPLLSPKMYREFFKPRHSQLWRRAKQRSDAKVMLHCCGGVRSLLPDLIDAGLDAINPVQISCRGMEGSELKREFGKDLTFWGGGCDTRQVLPNASIEAVRAHVLQQVRSLAPGGGFVFQQRRIGAAMAPVRFEWIDSAGSSCLPVGLTRHPLYATPASDSAEGRSSALYTVKLPPNWREQKSRWHHCASRATSQAECPKDSRRRAAGELLLRPNGAEFPGNSGEQLQHHHAGRVQAVSAAAIVRYKLWNAEDHRGTALYPDWA